MDNKFVCDWVVTKVGKKAKEKPETLVTRISDTAGPIHLKFRMQSPLMCGHLHAKFGYLQIKDTDLW